GLDLVAIGTIADYVMGLWPPQVGDREAIDANAECRELIGNQSGAESCRCSSFRRVAPIDGSKMRRGGKIRPLRRRKPLQPAAFLVDQDRGLAVADDSSKFMNQRRDLARGFNISFE